MPRVASTAEHGGRPRQRLYASSFGGVADLACLRADVFRSLMQVGRTRAHVRAVMLVMSELATNALLHGSPPYRVAVDADDRETVVEVSDADGTQVAPRPPAEAGGGYGLHLIEAIASRWDAKADSGSKSVRAAIASTSGI
jgi:two-component sensor histidine kinase